MEIKTLKIIELFAGMGAPAKALKNLNIPHEIIDVVEIDKNAMKAYNAVHGTNFETQDITKWDKNVKCDYLHASPPCQAFSTAGKNIGEADIRGKFLWEYTLIIIKQTQPKYVTLENVKGLTTKKHKKLLDWYLREMELLGYKNAWKILNSKDFGVPQNRERVFIISSKIGEPTFADFIAWHKPIASILDINAKWLQPKKVVQKNNLVYFANELSQYNGKLIELNIDLINKTFEPKINKIATIKKQDHYNFNFENLIDVSFCQDKHFFGVQGITGALTTTSPDFKNKIMYQSKDSWIFYRRLTALEVVRLMGFTDTDYYYMGNHYLSDSQICKISGNSIVVSVMEYVIKNLLK